MKKVKKMAVGGIPKSPVMPPKGGPVRPTPTPPPRPVRPPPTLPPRPVSPPPTLPPRPLVLPPRPLVNKSNNPSLPYLVDDIPIRLSSTPTPQINPQDMFNRFSGPLASPGMKKGGKVPSASKRADGIATKGKTRGKIV